MSATASLPAISLPKGGGAIRGIDEKLTVGQAAGTASLAVGVFTSPARQGFGPKLGLGYDSGAGNGPFGVGWSLGAPAITRKTSRGLPRYDDVAESDVFILAGVEDLVPTAQPPVGGSPQTVGASSFAVTAYRPRVEAGFTRIERWQDTASGEVHWRTISADNITSLYGQDATSRIADPGDPARVFTWFLDLSYDDRGNVISYVYKREDGVGAAHLANEVNRVVGANRYLKEVRYGNDRPYLPGVDGYTDLPAQPSGWLFRLVLDYGEHAEVAPAPEPEPGSVWSCRPDPFSSYRAGFEIRTYRTCRRLLMFHQFPELGDGAATLVRSTDLSYSTSDARGDPALPSLTLLEAVTETGYVSSTEGGYETLSMPPLQFGYEPLAVHGDVQVVGADSVRNLSASFDARERWVDLDGEGLQGVLTEDDGAWYYKHNISAWNPDGGPATARFEPLAVVRDKPVSGAAGGSLTLTDLNGDGNLSAVSFAAPSPGWFEYDADQGWGPFHEFARTANVDFASPYLRFVDLDGDGLADVLITEDDALTWYGWDVVGFEPAGRVAKPFDEERGPTVVFADPTASIMLADMSGDGLTDLVRIRSGEVCYWPNLGYARFGAKVTMDDAPAFDNCDEFDARRVRLADIDGSGTADLVYLGAQATVYFNQSGNSLTEGSGLTEFPSVDPDVRAAVFDLLGTGTACLVWTSPLPGDANAPLRYIDLTGGAKPHLLTSLVNNLGATKTLTYAPSTKFYLSDRAAGTPWLTRLPFPVHVVERVQIDDAVSATRYATNYSYHHGFYDGVEREFRGFARVDSTDTDTVPAASGSGTFTSVPPIDAAGGEFQLPPVLTRTWYHTGAFFGADDIAARLALEYWALDPAATKLGPTAFYAELPPGTGTNALTAEELREACRALRGRVLRQEVYGQDASALQGNPYVTTEHRYQVDTIQAPTGQSYGAFYVWEREALSCHYERNPADPRISHQLSLAIDLYGNVTQRASIAYARRDSGATTLPEAQITPVVAYGEAQFANADGDPDWLRIGLPVETRSFQITGLALSAGATLFDPDELLGALATLADIPYEAEPDGTPQRRLVAKHRTLYMNNTLAPLATGSVDSLALVYGTYTLRLTRSLLSAVLTPKFDTSELAAAVTSLLSGGPSGGAFVDLDADDSLWAPAPRLLYSDPTHAPSQSAARAGFYLARAAVDAWGNVATVSYDAAHQLFVMRTEDPIGGVTEAEINYRLCTPWLMTDPNLNRAGARFDALGRVVATAQMGKLVSGSGSSEIDEGDHLDTTSPEPSRADDPTAKLTYNLAGVPISVQTQARVRHRDPDTPWLQDYVYSDGLGRVALTKLEAEPAAGDAPYARGGPISRWVGSGKVVYDNKGNTVKAYEPFFDTTPDYTDESALVAQGVTAIARYDPLGRAYRVDNPDGTFRTIVFDPWQSVNSDENDNVKGSAWYAARTTGALRTNADQADAAAKAAVHDGTPEVTDFDVLGRVVRSTANNGPGGADQYMTTFTLDIQGQALATTDARGRAVLTQDYDMTGEELHRSSADVGDRWLLTDAGGELLRVSDSRGFTVTAAHDALRRPTALLVAQGGGAARTAEQIVYGESMPNPSNLTPTPAQVANLVGAVWQHNDEAGQATTRRRDFKGNVVSASRELLTDLVDDVDWAAGPGLTGEVFGALSTYDALDRLVTSTAPDGSVTTPVFNERNLLAGVGVNLRGAEAATTFVDSVSYDAKTQRQSIAYGNGATTAYSYDPQTFRLAALQTTRASDSAVLQDLTYTYDPAGNITRIGDAAQQVNFYNNQLVTPNADYTYDPVYRLIGAKGREHVANSSPLPPSWNDSATSNLPHPNDLQALVNYAEGYAYDAVGNLQSIAHQAGGSGWTRAYAYANPANNQLTSTTVGGTTEVYGYDAHGNMDSMPHLSSMVWDYKDQLQSTAAQIVSQATPASTSYRYDSDGRRIVKTNTAPGGALVSQRIYLGGYEIYRELNPAGVVTFERHTLHISDGTSRICLVDTVTVDATPLTATTAPRATPSTAIRYQFANHLESAMLELDGTAAVITYEEYYPYGSTAFQAGRSAAEVGLKRYRFTGRERDSENGFYYNGARYYAPWLARWTACDPKPPRSDESPYAYVGNRPTRMVDPTGLSGWDHFWGAVKAIGGALEVAAGVALFAAGAATAEFGIGFGLMAAGAFVTAHGLDTVQAGVRGAITGKAVDTFTSQGMQALGVPRPIANIIDATIGVVGSLGAGAAARAPSLAAAAGDVSTLVHVTSTAGAEAISEAGTLGRGASTLYAGGQALEEAGTAGRVGRTLLPAASTVETIRLPAAATPAFRVPALIGPTTLWQRWAGSVYSAGAGSLDLTTGVFTRTGPALNQWLFYGFDAVSGGIMRVGGPQALTPPPAPAPGEHASAAPADVQPDAAASATVPGPPPSVAPNLRLRLGPISPLDQDPAGGPLGPVDELAGPRQSGRGLGLSVSF